MSRDPFNYQWVEDQRIVAGSLPTSSECINVLNKLGVRAILSLTRRDLDCPGMSEALHGIIRLHCPIVDGSAPNELTMWSAISFINNNIKASIPVYVHCRAGVGRTGTILMAHYVLHDSYTLQQARDKVRVRTDWRGTTTAADVTQPQREWLETLAAKVGKL